MRAKTIIIGAGSTGCVIANRLSARSDQEVVLIEAGPDYVDQPLPHDLADGTRNSFSAHDWGFNHRVNSVQTKMFPLPRGRVVGGSSAVNTCIALRPQPYDIDEWQDHGAQGWTWDACLPYLNRLESDLDFGQQAAHGADGPMPIRRHPKHEWVAWQAAFVDACLDHGYAECPDGNLAGSAGVGPHAMNKLEGRRISAAEVYLTPEVRARENLQILPNMTAYSLELRGDKIAGVVARSGGEEHWVQGDRFICCLGAIQTPRILLASGIGPKVQVEGMGVAHRLDNPAVNPHLLDHPGFAILYRKRWGAPVHTTDPLIQTLCRTGSGLQDNDVVMQAGSRWAFPFGNFANCSLMAMIGKPKGRGRIIFTSVNPEVSPRVESALLDHDEDRALATKTMHRLYELSLHPAMRDVCRPLVPFERVLKNPERLQRWIRRFSDSGYHPCGTVPMGEEGYAACDIDGRVFGTQNLYVGDASLMPTIPHANIHLSTLMIAERLSAMWLGEEG